MLCRVLGDQEKPRDRHQKTAAESQGVVVERAKGNPELLEKSVSHSQPHLHSPVLALWRQVRLHALSLCYEEKTCYWAGLYQSLVSAKLWTENKHYNTHTQGACQLIRCCWCKECHRSWQFDTNDSWVRIITKHDDRHSNLHFETLIKAVNLQKELHDTALVCI